jgi:hypothetical protein
MLTSEEMLALKAQLLKVLAGGALPPSPVEAAE